MLNRCFPGVSKSRDPSLGFETPFYVQETEYETVFKLHSPGSTSSRDTQRSGL
jgi:hypothetical protein